MSGHVTDPKPPANSEACSQLPTTSQILSTPEDKGSPELPANPNITNQLPHLSRSVRSDYVVLSSPCHVCPASSAASPPPTLTPAEDTASNCCSLPGKHPLVDPVPAIPVQPSVFRLSSGKAPQSILHPSDQVLSRLMKRCLPWKKCQESRPLHLMNKGGRELC